jgi:hypothetical protein
MNLNLLKKLVGVVVFSSFFLTSCGTNENEKTSEKGIVGKMFQHVRLKNYEPEYYFCSDDEVKWIGWDDNHYKYTREGNVITILDGSETPKIFTVYNDNMLVLEEELDEDDDKKFVLKTGKPYIEVNAKY